MKSIQSPKQRLHQIMGSFVKNVFEFVLFLLYNKKNNFHKKTKNVKNRISIEWPFSIGHLPTTAASTRAPSPSPRPTGTWSGACASSHPWSCTLDRALPSRSHQSMHWLSIPSDWVWCRHFWSLWNWFPHPDVSFSYQFYRQVFEELQHLAPCCHLQYSTKPQGQVADRPQLPDRKRCPDVAVDNFPRIRDNWFEG